MIRTQVTTIGEEKHVIVSVVRVNQGVWLRAQGVRPKKKEILRFAQNDME